jgi:hypothetical protein
MYEGTVVADCAGDTIIQVGDEDLTISSLIYHPYRLTEVQVGSAVSPVNLAHGQPCNLHPFLLFTAYHPLPSHCQSQP